MRTCPNCLAPISWGEKTALDHRGDCTLVYCNSTCQSEYVAKQSKKHEPPVHRTMLLIVLGLLIAVGVIWKAWGQPPPNTSGLYKEWFTSQLQEDNLPTPCCGGEFSEGGDAHPVNVRYIGHDKELGDRYEVQVGDQWLLYPRVVPSILQNPTGQNYAWYITNSDGSIYWYCLRVALGV